MGRLKQIFKCSISALFIALSALVFLQPAELEASSVPVIKAYRSPKNATRKQRRITKFIILHTTEGSARGALEKLSKNGECHYMVARDGKIYTIIDKNRIAYHAGVSMWNGQTGLDSMSIGIEIAGYHNKEITNAQYTSLKRLIAELKATYGIDDNRVLTHSMVAYGNPNRWQKRKHRGRKRCGMLLAKPENRLKLGLKSKPLYDPDVRAGRLIDADPELSKILYSRPKNIPVAQTRTKPIPVTSTATVIKPSTPTVVTNQVTQTKPNISVGATTTTNQPLVFKLPSNIIGPDRSAWDIARDLYNSADTIYHFPDGSTKTGKEVKKWKSMPEGTRVEIGGGEGSENPDVTLMEIGKDGTVLEITGDEILSDTTFYFPSNKKGYYLRGSQQTQKKIEDLPDGSFVLVGYKVGGPISAKKPVFEICGLKWNMADTYYFNSKKGTLTSGADMDEKNIPLGAYVFYQE